MCTVAFIGGDGAGKTTIAKKLVESCSLPMKYLYMGFNTQASNVALPTSRLILRKKVRAYKKTATKRGITDPNFLTTQHPEHRKVRRGWVGSALRLVHRLTEEWFRQLVSWCFQLRGYVVVYDRHYWFDTALAPAPGKKHTLERRMHHWILDRFYPKPDMVFLLDAEPSVLVARKQEVSLDFLERRRRAFMEKGKDIDRFFRIDATREPARIVEEVSKKILHAYNPKRSSLCFRRVGKGGSR